MIQYYWQYCSIMLYPTIRPQFIYGTQPISAILFYIENMTQFLFYAAKPKR